MIKPTLHIKKIIEPNNKMHTSTTETSANPKITLINIKSIKIRVSNDTHQLELQNISPSLSLDAALHVRRPAGGVVSQKRIVIVSHRRSINKLGFLGNLYFDREIGRCRFHVSGQSDRCVDRYTGCKYCRRKRQLKFL